MPPEAPDLSEADRIRLLHMLDAAKRAVAFAAGRQRGQLQVGDIETLGLIKCIEIIGEAAGRVSDATMARLPDIPWRSIIAMRHRTVHGYDDVNLDIVWTTATQSLPPLVDSLEAALASWPIDEGW